MRNIKTYTILLLLMLLGDSLNAQWQLGLLGGLNMANTTQAPPSGTKNGYNLGTDMGVLLGSKVLNKKFSIQAEYTYSKRGPKFVTDTNEYGMRNSYHVGTILGKFTFTLYKKIDGHLIAGGYGSYWTFSRSMYEYGGVGIRQSNKIKEHDPILLAYDYTFNWSNVNYGVCIGGGLSLRTDKYNSIFIDLRYEGDITENGKYKCNPFDYTKRMPVYAIAFKVGYIYTFGTRRLLNEMIGPKR